mmetsp:Transcript_96561/g.216251  ORF Transcript_96561/g.216251 Transcript_96561/m.216251 type:complete len:171 (-) Transcript_96561:61-573(-)
MVGRCPARAPTLVGLLLASCWWLAAAKEKKAVAPTGCSTCQSVAHLLVKARKELTSENDAKAEDRKGNNEIAALLFSEREKRVCSEELLKPYADYLKLKPAAMVKTCKNIVPEKFEFKSAQDLRSSLASKKPRSAIAQLMCVEGGRCEKLWSKEEEPWQNWHKKKAKDEM